MLTKLNLNKINNLIKDTNVEFISLKETKNGITDSTYIGTKIDNTKYIFKVFETSTKEHIKNKIDILNALKDFNVPHPLSKEIILYDNKPTALFSYIDGKIIQDIKLIHIEQISNFLKKLHSIDSFKPLSKNIYEKAIIEKMIVLVDNPKDKKEFQIRYKFVKNIKLDNNSIIHGDLFPDNAKFLNDSLSGVYDFTQSCYGNRYFDFAVMIISWCFNEFDFKLDFLKKALDTYDKEIDIKFIKPYLLYASLYYSLQRYTRTNKAKDYKEMLDKFDILKKILDE